MSSDSSPGGTRRVKPVTRSSFRQSLNLAGKALVDVINKDGRDNKNAKKTKEKTARRSSVILPESTRSATPRASLGSSDAKPLMPASKRVESPDSKTITRRRMSAATQRLSSEENNPKSPDAATPQAGVKRSSSLRPRPTGTAGAASALPKLRPKSVIAESGAKIPSPPRIGTRRRLSSSDEEKGKQKDVKQASPAEKAARPISPLPHRAALKANLSNAIRLTPSPTRAKAATPASTKTSPSRPIKSAKTSAASAASSIPRPPSASSSSSSFTPRTPNSVKGGPSARRLITQKAATTKQSTPPRSAREQSESPSPFAGPSRLSSASNTPTRLRTFDVGNMSHISEVNDEDSFEEGDVEMLLAPVAAIGAPTPAMPRIAVARPRLGRLEPETPTRSGLDNLPNRSKLSYVSPLPADKERSTLRPPTQGSGKAARGSILSWEQLADEASRTLEEAEIEHMLSDIPAPFRSGAASPTTSNFGLDIPESPCLGAINSPGGFGSISQVLLPDVTPSPAVHIYAHKFDHPPVDLPGAFDASIVTSLRLQLAATENENSELRLQIQTRDDALRNAAMVRQQDAENLGGQVANLEARWLEGQQVRERAEEDRLAYIASLEEQLRQASMLKDRAVQEASSAAESAARSAHAASARQQHRRWDAVCSAQKASTHWSSVYDLAQTDLAQIEGDKAVLQMLRGALDRLQRDLCLPLTT
ncbi:hypothetical protein HGRIS_007487 [Hohenbuehelia grisea]|uniref:Uncharacterized protein n=1 Tax=Hohenbuehelia grisea TaxID=104357 RepID=A0ABR3J5R1_9AGAR